MVPADSLTPRVCASLMKISEHVTMTAEQINTLRAQIKTLQSDLGIANLILTEQATMLDVDKLTNVGTRRGFENEIQRLVARRSRAEKTFPEATVVMFDLDKFKEINSEFSHIGGDTALQKAADTVRKSLREGDYLARWGGDEFVAIMYDVKAEQGDKIAAKIAQSVKELQVCHKTLAGEDKLMPLSITCATHALTKKDKPESIVADLSAQVLQKKADSGLTMVEEYRRASAQHNNRAH